MFDFAVDFPSQEREQTVPENMQWFQLTSSVSWGNLLKIFNLVTALLISIKTKTTKILISKVIYKQKKVEKFTPLHFQLKFITLIHYDHPIICCFF